MSNLNKNYQELENTEIIINDFVKELFIKSDYIINKNTKYI